MNKDWWKWGNPDQLRHLNEYPKFKAYLEERWGITLREDFFPPKDFDIVPIPEKKQEQVKDIFASVSARRISFKATDRLLMALGKSYYDVIRIIDAKTIVTPDAVITPLNHEEVQYIVKQASDHGVQVIPMGGGSNVVGALSLEKDSKAGFRISLNLRQMDKLLHIDEQHFTATFQAGIMGPKLEEILNEKGFTLGHFPQSFEYSSLGGWVVTRSAGQESTYYGKIEDLVESISVATPAGTIHTNHFTHDAMGINLLPLFFGSEGTLGVVTEVTIKLSKLHGKRRWLSALFPTFEDGANVMKEMIQNSLHPSVARLSDATETMMFSKISSGSEPENWVSKMKKDAQKLVLKFKNLEEPCLLILKLEEPNASIASQVVYAKELISKYRGMYIGSAIGEQWEHNRYGTPYLRDSLVEHRIVIDTMETLVPWQDVHHLHRSLGTELEKSKAFNKAKGIYLAHISHIYPNACCLYITLMTPMHPGRELDQWHEIKKLVTDTILKCSGSVSHHHGIGSDHQDWYLRYSDPLTLEVLKAVKQKLDPKGVLNPGKVFDV
jgi:alkyldihydroxyacetonephosphate synthase